MPVLWKGGWKEKLCAIQIA